MSNEKTSTRPLLDKLGVKAFHRISVIGVDDDAFWGQLTAGQAM